MNIRYKLIEHERIGDAPFVGALISATDCNFNCNNCFNQNIKNMSTKEKTDIEIIEEIKSNLFNKGIILAGLEWSLQIDEAIAISRIAQENNLLTMLYTGNEFLEKEYFKYFDYVKVGLYKEDLISANHIEYGVTLATSNQHIYKKGIDY